MRFKQTSEYDNHNHALTKEQSEFFKNSVVRDTLGRLQVCYHGTRYYGFNNFDPNGMDSGFSFFTVNYKYAQEYLYLDDGEDDNEKGVYYCYLNIENPIDLGDIESPIFAKGHDFWEIKDGKYYQVDLNNVPEEYFSEEFKTLARKVNMTPKDLLLAPQYVDDNMIFAVTRRPEFADIIVKLGYDGIITGEYSGKAHCYGVPYQYNNQIKSIKNKTPSNSENINEKTN